MKTTWGIAAALLLVAATAMDTSARGRGGKQGFHGHGKRSGHKGALVEQLGLSEDQQAQIQALKEDIRGQRQALGEEYRAGFEAILTDEQRDALAGLKTNRGKRDSLVEQLGLSDDQQAQIQALREGLNEQKQALGEEYRAGFEAILTAEQYATFEEIKANRGSHSKGSEEESETAAAGKATTAVEETSWGRVKESFGR